MNKSELRKIYLDRQKNISPNERTRKSNSISERFSANFDLTEINLLHCFLPIEKFNEIDTRPILQKIWRDFSSVTTLAPRIDFQKNKIENVKFTAQTNLAENAWQILEPVGNETIETKKIDLILIPLLCVDFQGFRVGYGKGFYDKFLKDCRIDCLKIGLSYFAPVTKISDAQNFDVKLDFCVTPEKIFRF